MRGACVQLCVPSDCLRLPVTGKCAKMPRKGTAPIQHCTEVESLHVGYSYYMLLLLCDNPPPYPTHAGSVCVRLFVPSDPLPPPATGKCAKLHWRRLRQSQTELTSTRYKLLRSVYQGTLGSVYHKHTTFQNAVKRMPRTLRPSWWVEQQIQPQVQGCFQPRRRH